MPHDPGADLDQLLAQRRQRPLLDLLKALLRKAVTRTKAALWSAIGQLIASIPADECANYLRNCGYGST